MPKVGMAPIRRRELIEATVATIRSEGFAETTVARISRRAGVSTGIVHHYFKDKNALLEATMRSLATDLGREVSTRLAAARTPRQRVEAVIDANFAPSLYHQEAVITWLCFWAQVPFSEQIARIQRVIYGRLRSNLGYGLRRLVPADRIDRVVLALVTHIDGLWLRCALTDGGLDAALARRLARDFLEHQLGGSAHGSAR